MGKREDSMQRREALAAQRIEEAAFTANLHPRDRTGKWRRTFGTPGRRHDVLSKLHQRAKWNAEEQGPMRDPWDTGPHAPPTPLAHGTTVYHRDSAEQGTVIGSNPHGGFSHNYKVRWASGAEDWNHPHTVSTKAPAAEPRLGQYVTHKGLRYRVHVTTPDTLVLRRPGDHQGLVVKRSEVTDARNPAKPLPGRANSPGELDFAALDRAKVAATNAAGGLTEPQARALASHVAFSQGQGRAETPNIHKFSSSGLSTYAAALEHEIADATPASGPVVDDGELAALHDELQRVRAEQLVLRGAPRAMRQSAAGERRLDRARDLLESREGKA